MSTSLASVQGFHEAHGVAIRFVGRSEGRQCIGLDLRTRAAQQVHGFGRHNERCVESRPPDTPITRLGMPEDFNRCASP
jgi:hypothetical protein